MAAMVRKSVLCAREVAVLMNEVRKLCVLNDVSDNPSFSTAVAYAFQMAEEFEQRNDARRIDYRILMELDKSIFGIPDSFQTDDVRFNCNLRCSADLLARIDSLTEFLGKVDFPDSRVYRNFAIRALMRAAVAIDKGFCPTCERGDGDVQR